MIEADLSKAVDLHDYNEKLEQELKKAHGEEYTDYLDAISRYSSEIKSYREIGTWQGASTSRILLEKIPYVHTIDNDLKKYLKSVNEKVVKIKLREAINSIDKFCKIDSKSKVVSDSVIVQTMRYMELLKELKKSGKKQIV